MDNLLWSSFKIIAALFLVLLNAFFVAAEFSLVKVRKTRLVELAEHGSKKAAVAFEVSSRLDAYLSACQLGITLASLGLGWLGEPAIATLLEPLFRDIVGWSSVYTHTIAAIIAFLVITFLHIVLGELVPKSLAIAKAEGTALNTAGLLRLFYRIFFPAIWALNGLANSFLKIFGIHQQNEADLAHSEEELRMLVDASEKYGILDKMEGALLDNVFEFSDRVAGEVMIPRQDMVCMYIQDSLEEALRTAREFGHSRYPLCDDDKDNIVGLIHIRDLLDLNDRTGIKEISQLKREVMIVPETIPISHLVHRMRSQRTHMAVVADEYGGTAGLITIEDIIEELVGEIYDEFDPNEPDVKKISDTEYEVNGRFLLEELPELIGIRLDEEEVITVGGYIFARLGRKPRKGDEVEAMGYLFQILEVAGIRILKVRIIKKENTQI
ncbi:MAG TPA: hemolysin family protein [Bacillota bacterium]|nr:hemolysin family protein [Bacillota bacterium]